jgi:serine/threonine protein kinase
MDNKVNSYEMIRSLGKGGMGEVFLVKDPNLGRLIALKKIREDLAKNKTMQERFLREAKIAAQLTHPSIIQIYSISEEKENVYYTMPFIEGETLSEILQVARKQEKNGEHLIGGSIPSLMRIFLSICQAIAYVHSKKILHRDLKPDNILVGKYGEVVILDWGLADYAEKDDATFPDVENSGNLTHPGKIPGTLGYMAPERALGEKTSYSTDIYALGVMLYQMLTLKLPFHRTTLAEYRKWMAREELMDPSEAAPYRDIPLQLSAIAKKCLSAKKEERFQTVHELLEELQNYSEGKPEWIPTAELNIHTKQDWEFQENILLTKHLAITRSPEVMEWVNLMYSRGSFLGNIRLETKVCLGSTGKGIGILLCIPEAHERVGLADGYWLWVSSANDQMSKLFRSSVEVMEIPEVGLKPGVWHTLSIEKLDNHLRFYLDGKLQCHYISYRPMVGTHVGLLFRDADFQMETLRVFVGSQNVQVNCLAIPDAFLANRLYPKALNEYRRISYSFPGRAEGREALFRAGITFLEQALFETKKPRRQQLFSLALEEFNKLRVTPGAPLEYLGKSLVYKALHEIEDEAKCLELALRKYPKHPLLHILIEEIIFRLHESTTQDRKAGYLFALLALRHLPQIFQLNGNKKLLESLKTNLEPLFFIEPGGDETLTLCIQLAFWLAKPIPIMEILESTKDPITINNAFFALLYLGCDECVKEHPLFNQESSKLALAIDAGKKPAHVLKKFFEDRSSLNAYEDARLMCLIFDRILDYGKSSMLLPYLKNPLQVSAQYQDQVNARLCRAYILEKKWQEVESIFKSYPSSELENSRSPLFSLYSCFLRKTQGEEAAREHFSNVAGISDAHTATLLARFFTKKVALNRLFYFEKLQLMRQLILYFEAAKSSEAKVWKTRLKKEIHHIAKTYMTL